MRVNPFATFYAKCNTGTGPEKLTTLADGPRLVDLEVASLCNMRCTMCPTGLLSLGRSGQFMTMDTFLAVLNSTAAYDSALRFIGWGEPLLHPQLLHFVGLAARRGRLTHLNTNGTKLSDGAVSCANLIETGLTSIKFSFQGTDAASYYDMRRSDFFDRLLLVIQTFHAMRGSRQFPFIAASTTTTTESPEEIEDFRARLAPYVDQLSIGRTVFDFIDTTAMTESARGRLEAAAKTSSLVKRHPNPCPEVYDKLSIHADGSVHVCCNDYAGHTQLGNINTDKIYTIWQHPVLQAYRERLAEGRYEGPLCSVCYEYMDGLTEKS